MKKEIGSNFWLSDEDIKKDTRSLSSPSIFNCNGSDYVWLSTCRSAISLVIQTIEERNPNINKRVCLPAFTCNTVFEPFINAGYEFYPLNVGKDLGSNAQDLLNTILESKVGIVLFHRYFGFDTLYNIDSIIPILQKNGISIIEDCTQSMYSNIDRINADYYVGSIRKWCGVPDGGFAVCKHGYFSNKPQSYDIDLEKAKYEACLMKYNFLFNNKGKKEDFLIGYREAEDILDKQDRFYNIAPLSIKVQSNLDVDWMKNKRQENYRTLLNLLNKSNNIIPVFEELPENVVPLYFPILCMNRKEIQSTLVQNSIYAPIVWPKDEKCPKISIDSDYIYDHILCIPIDQRYSSDDMERVAEILNNFN
jgi:hypothetical protein